MKSGYLLHFFAGLTLLLGIWIFFSEDTDTSEKNKPSNESASIKSESNSSFTKNKTIVSNDSDRLNISPRDFSSSGIPGEDQVENQSRNKPVPAASNLDPQAVASDYITAWKNKDKQKIKQLWAQISECEACLLEFVDLVVNKKLEKGMLLEVAIKMTKLDTDVVLPVFDALIDPAGNRSTTIILSEKLIKSGRPEFVTKVFEIIHHADENGYKNFARQLTWVVSRIDNPEGIKPILDTIIGRTLSNPEFSTHVSNVFSKVVQNLPEATNAGNIIADYFLRANGQEQQRLWQVASKHGGALVSLAMNADSNGQNYNVQKYAKAMSELPHLQAVDSLMQLHVGVEYSPDYIQGMLADKVKDNPTIKVLHKLEDYMRNPDVKLESRLFAAEGLLAVGGNRQARYILEKVINNTQDPDAELQAYIGGRL